MKTIEILKKSQEKIKLQFSEIQSVQEEVSKWQKVDWENWEQHFSECIRMMALQGWFLTGEMIPADFLRLKESLEKEKIEEINREMIETVDYIFDNQCSNLLNQHQDRGKALEQAFQAHREEKYYLSIPVFYAQAEGIWNEKFSSNFFGNPPPSQSIIENLKKQYSERLDILIAAATYEISPVGIGKAKKFKSAENLSRHNIMHGSSYSYGTRLNSYKAFSLLGFSSFIEC